MPTARSTSVKHAGDGWRRLPGGGVAHLRRLCRATLWASFLIFFSGILVAAQTARSGSSTAVPPCRPDSSAPDTIKLGASSSTGAVATQDAAQPSEKPPSGNATRPCNDTYGVQTKRILGIIPNYRAVSVDTHLPPQPVKEKLWMATQDSFEYSSFVLAGFVAGYSQLTNATPEFRTGFPAFGRYYWHSFVDEAVGNYFTEAIVPSVTREDPRYYTLGRNHGGFFRRSGYALSRLVVTRTDSGGSTFNCSEIIGNALGAGTSDFYYPKPVRTLGQTSGKWATQVGIDGIANVLKEFWPDISRRILHDAQ